MAEGIESTDDVHGWVPQPGVRTDLPRGYVLPLNSKRLTTKLMKRLAVALDISTSATSDDLSLLIAGKLEEMDREPRNVQVLVQEMPRGSYLSLQDMDGVFVRAEPPEPPEEREDTPSDIERDEPELGDGEGGALREALDQANQEKELLQNEVRELTEELGKLKIRVRELWGASCDHVVEHDRVITAKDEEIASLREQLGRLSPSMSESEAHGHHGSTTTRTVPPLATSLVHTAEHEAVRRPRRGKAPPVDPFTGENPAIRLDEWLPSLQRASRWNGWSSEEELMQLAGHLRGRALQEWNLLCEVDLRTFDTAVKALRDRLDPSSKVLAGQDFRHTTQGDSETVANFITKLERVFQVAYGNDKMSPDTREAILYGQLQEGLSLELMKSPSVSGAMSYKELCMSAKNEERRQSELKKRLNYRRSQSSVPPTKKPGSQTDHRPVENRSSPARAPAGSGPKRCYNCNKLGHLSFNCRAPKTESNGRNREQRRNPTSAKTVMAAGSRHPQNPPQQTDDPLDFLASSSSESEDDSDIRLVRLEDKGSHPKCARVCIQGVPAYGIVDSGADITIIGGELFKKVAAVARLRKKDFKDADKTPKNYDGQPFSLDGRMNLDITFNDIAINTPVYIKMDAHDQLLLSEGICRQLGIISYHPDVEVWRGGKQKNRKKTPATQTTAQVPTVRVLLLQATRVPPHQSAVAAVQVDEQLHKGPLLLESDPSLEESTGLLVDTSLIQSGQSRVLISNPTGYTQKIEKGTQLGTAMRAKIVSVATEGTETQALADQSSPAPPAGSTHSPHQHSAASPVEGVPIDSQPNVNKVSSQAREQKRKEKLLKLLEQQEMDIPGHDKEKLCSLLAEQHEAFILEEKERGETDLIQFHIDTGDAQPKKQALRRTPFAVRQEVARQLKEMQETGVIQPSTSPWASPIVLVRKKDGSLRFCIDYRHLNSVTKVDTYPLPRIDDLLDQLGKAKYFSTLDLASGYWQIPVHPDSQEKTAFVTTRGLFEFRVMPFGLRNAPAAFQRLMERVLMGLNPEDGADFVDAYIDDVLIFSQTLEEHLHHLSLVLDTVKKADLKLKLPKCKFFRKEVEFLGHLVTTEGLKPNHAHTTAVTEFPTPRNVKEIRQFVGLASYYRRFIPNFAKIAHPLHALTRKGAPFSWTDECQEAFTTLKQKLSSGPVLAYPDFGKDFVLETDASIRGLGAVLSQKQSDGKLHPIAFASRALSPPEKNYAVTELETLAVVWACSHYHAYLYGHDVTVYTDHSAVKAILETPSPSGKHARWWSRVYGSGVKSVQIIYRAGKDNANADALSRNPQLPAPAEDMADTDVQVAAITTTNAPELDITSLLEMEPGQSVPDGLGPEQRKDPALAELIAFIVKEELPAEEKRAKIVVAQASMLTMVDDILYYVDPKQENRRRVVVPKQLRKQIMEENHSGPMAGHFSGNRMYNVLVRHWWWQGMYTDTLQHCKNCPQCAVVTGSGRRNKPLLQPIPVERAFQIVGVDVMDLPKTERGNQHVVVFQDFLTKWPMVFPIPDQKAVRIARLLADEVIPTIGVPEALLSDRGTNLLSHLMMDVCKLLGIKKLNTTAYHPQCDGMVERFNRTLKSMLRKHAATFGNQWDQYLPGLLWAYRNTPHESTGEKPSFLLYGLDCRSPTEAALHPPHLIEPTNVSDYRQELILSLAMARKLAAESIQKAQRKYKAQYDKKAKPADYRVGDWVMVHFPQEESGALRKLSRPWHGPYRLQRCDGPDATVVKVYFPQDGGIQVHQTRIQHCPDIPAGFYWYGGKRSGPGRPPKWTSNIAEKGKAKQQKRLGQQNQSKRRKQSKQQKAELQQRDTPKQPPPRNPKATDNHEPVVNCRYPLRNRSGRAP